jgi:hypothetical protein
MSIGPPARGWRSTLWNHRLSLAAAPIVILLFVLFAVLFANVVEIPGTEPWLRQGAAGSLLVVAATALLGSTTAAGGAGLVRCRRKTSMWEGCKQ